MSNKFAKNDVTFTQKIPKRKLMINPMDKTSMPKKRFAISPQFQHNNLRAMVTRKVRSPDLMRPISPASNNPIDTSSKTFNVRECLNSTYGKDTRKEFEFYLERHGGTYQPAFGFQNLFESQSHKTGWSRFLSILKEVPADENVARTIKQMKGQK